jgi:hypothetical protein
MIFAKAPFIAAVAVVPAARAEMIVKLLAFETVRTL